MVERKFHKEYRPMEICSCISCPDSEIKSIKEIGDEVDIIGKKLCLYDGYVKRLHNFPIIPDDCPRITEQKQKLLLSDSGIDSAGNILAYDFSTIEEAEAIRPITKVPLPMRISSSLSDEAKEVALTVLYAPKELLNDIGTITKFSVRKWIMKRWKKPRDDQNPTYKLADSIIGELRDFVSTF